MKLLYPDQPMQRNPSALNDLDNGHYFEDAKEDGWRLELLVNEDGGYQPLSRHNKPLAVSPKVMEAVKALGLPPNTQLDGEWMRMRESTQAIGMPETIIFYDVLKYGGEDLRGTGCLDRRQRLLEILGLDPIPASAMVVDETGKKHDSLVVIEYDWKPDDMIRVPDVCLSGFRTFFEQQMKKPWTEGVVIKKRNAISKASPQVRDGSRAKVGTWFKVKWRGGDSGLTPIY